MESEKCKWKFRAFLLWLHPPPASSSIQHMTGIFRAVSSLNLSAGWFDLREYAVLMVLQERLQPGQRKDLAH